MEMGVVPTVGGAARAASCSAAVREIVPDGGMLLAKSMSVDMGAGIAAGSRPLDTPLPLGIEGTPSGGGADGLPTMVLTKLRSSASSDEIWANSAMG